MLSHDQLLSGGQWFSGVQLLNRSAQLPSSSGQLLSDRQLKSGVQLLSSSSQLLSGGQLLCPSPGLASLMDLADCFYSVFIHGFEDIPDIMYILNVRDIMYLYYTKFNGAATATMLQRALFFFIIFLLIN